LWSLVEAERVTGLLFNRAGGCDGEVVITSPVVRIIVLGEVPIAVTRSGSRYGLGMPSPSLGDHAATSFLLRKAGDQASVGTAIPDAEDATSFVAAGARV
jgi:hypothetical protein